MQLVALLASFLTIVESKEDEWTRPVRKRPDYISIGRFDFNLRGLDGAWCTPRDCSVDRELKDCPLIERNDSCPLKTLANRLFDKLEVNDRNYTVVPIIQNEAGSHLNYNPLSFSVTKYIQSQKDNGSSVVNLMFRNICNLTDEWPPLVKYFTHFDSRNLWFCKYCNSSVPETPWEIFWSAIFDCDPEQIKCKYRPW